MKNLFLRIACLAAVLLCWAGMAQAALPFGPDKPGSYTVTEKAPGVYHFKILIICKDGNTFYHAGGEKSKWWADEGTYCGINMMVNDKPKDIVTFASTAYTTSSGGYNSAVINLLEGHILFTHSSEEYNSKFNPKALTLPFNSQEAGQPVWLEFDWYAPAEMQVQGNAKFVAKIVCYKTENNNCTQVGKYAHTMKDLSTLPQFMTATTAIDMGDGMAKAGQMMIPFSSQEKVNGHKFDNNAWVNYPNPANSGMVYIPIADTIRKNIPILFHIPNTSTGHVQPDDQDAYTITIPEVLAYHGIYNLTVGRKVNEDGLNHGELTLKWRVKHPEAKDAMEGDMWEIQRAEKEDFSDAVSIDIININKKDTLYTYTDSSDVVLRSQKVGAKMYYRVRRATAQTWKWDDLYACHLAAKTAFSFTEHLDYTKYFKPQGGCLDVYELSYGGELPQGKYIAYGVVDQGREDERQAHDVVGIGVGHIIKQPTVSHVMATKDVQWETNRKVHISAIAKRPAIFKYIGGLTSAKPGLPLKDHSDIVNCKPDAPDPGRMGTAMTLRHGAYETRIYLSFEITEKQDDNIYWDKDHATLYLIRTAVNGQDTLVTRTAVPNDSIRWNKKNNQYEIHMTDLSNLACHTYSYAFELDTTTHILPLTSDAGEIKSANVNPESFYFDDGMHISEVAASDSTEADYTWIRWSTTGGNFDYYQIRRRRVGESSWKMIDSACYAMEYYDRTAPVGKTCEYEVTGVLNCHGRYTDTKTDQGTRSRWGSISGRVSYPSGAGCANILITVYNGTGAKYRETYTDEKGYYEADSVLFSDATITYSVVATHPRMPSVNFLNAAGQPGGQQVLLNGWTAHPKNINFTNASGMRFTGRVLFDGSTVPVHHAQFKVNGELQLLADGTPVETDASGNFELLIPGGAGVRDSVQVVMEGHTFKNDGYIQVVEGQNGFDMEKPIDDTRAYDLTKAKLIGHVVGGVKQGILPLGYDLTKNNLGDNITLVLELEGDNISHLVHNPLNLNEKERDTIYDHFADATHRMKYHDPDGIEHQTHMHMTQKRITIYPDPVSGEYQVDLYPVRYKVVQATAKGYSTLFPTGTTSQSIDLSRSIAFPKDTIQDTVYLGGGKIEPKQMVVNEHYSLIYRSPIVMSYKQLKGGIMEVDYLGEANLVMNRLNGTDTTICILRQHEDTTRHKYVTDGYVLGHPVYKTGSSYTYSVYAHEDYYYNNDPTSIRHQQDTLKNQVAYVFNGMAKSDSVSIVPLGETGIGQVTLRVDNPTFALAGDAALRTIEMRTKVDGLYVYAQPIQGFVTGSRFKGEDFIQQLGSRPVILDIVRDPYGSGSSAYISKGTTYSVSNSSTFTYSLGVELGISTGANFQNVTGAWAGFGGGMFAGFSMAGSTVTEFSVPITTGGKKHSSYSYSYTTSENISTSSAPTMVGAMADVYVGTEQTLILAQTDAVTLIDSSIYRLRQPAIQAGTILVLSDPAPGLPYYLVRSEEIALGDVLGSEFHYTQKHILNTLIPNLLKKRNSMLLCDSENALKNLANQRKQPVYQSLVSETHDDYGVSYKMIPTDSLPTKVQVDSISLLNQTIQAWVDIIAQNETAKAEAMRGTPMKTISISDGTTESYSESTSHAGGSINQWSGISADPSKLITNIFGGGKYGGQKLDGYTDGVNKKGQLTVQANLVGTKLGFIMRPVVKFDAAENSDYQNGKSKTAGYTIATGTEGYENISIYRVVNKNSSFNQGATSDRNDAHAGTGQSADKTEHMYADFVFERNGGATRCPYEGEEKSLFLKREATFAAATLHIDNPTISIDTREQSNVPADEPATFVVTLSDETDMPLQNNFKGTNFVLFVDDASNEKGMRIYMDGEPLTSGRVFFMKPGESVQKTIQVYRGTGYDFEDVSLVFMHECQTTLKAETHFSVHYQPVSCPVSLTLPVDKWVLNTLSPKDEQGYYLPVDITGFNVGYDEFDHIELQYKLQTQGDDKWVNLCSYYADSALFVLASGNKQMIENGQIRNVRFYGERDPMEQQYDLRAVSFCRLGTSFVTRASEVRSGLKDTRVPTIFGTPTPGNGILRVGDYISLPFSEDIAANYLDKDNNFDITGYTNTSTITSSTSLYFPDNTVHCGMTQVNRSLSGKDFTFDVMVRPEHMADTMLYMMLGSNESLLALGQSRANVNTDRPCFAFYMFAQGEEHVVYSDTLSQTEGWLRAVVTYDTETGSVHFYQGNKDITRKDSANSYLPPHYSGNGAIILGAYPRYTNHSFVGSMLEARVWQKALSGAEVAATNFKRLTGYENGLLAYYRLNEGRGTEVPDRANGAVMNLYGTSWKNPEGLSFVVGKPVLNPATNVPDHYEPDTVALDGNAFALGIHSDFSLTFWFRTMSDAACTLFSARNFRIEADAKGITLSRINDEHEVDYSEKAYGSYLGGEWHQLAVTCNKSKGYGAMFIDGVNVMQFNAMNIDAPTDSRMFVGPMAGTIDDITYWSIALPDNYLQEYYTHSPNDKEMGLVTHVSFSERRLNSSGVYETRYCPFNLKKHYDEAGHEIPRKPTDRVILCPDSLINEHRLQPNAPVAEKGDLVKMNFSWIGRDNELVIDLKMLDKEINKQNIFFTVRDVEDLAGNPMQAPVSWMVFVDRNQLRWSDKYITTAVEVGTDTTFVVDIINAGGAQMNYYVEDLPWWLSVNKPSGVLEPLGEHPLRFTISDKLDPGEHTAIIYLTDENGLSEPLRVVADVHAVAPTWKIDPQLGDGTTMDMFAQVRFNGIRQTTYFDTDERDIVAAFVGRHCVGLANIRYADNTPLVCLPIYGTSDPTSKFFADNTPIRFQLWKASTGQIYALTPKDEDGKSFDIFYKPNTMVGTADAPIQLYTTRMRTQEITLQEGWNWISFYIDPSTAGEQFYDAFTGSYEFSTNDLVKWGGRASIYDKDGEWVAGGTKAGGFHFYSSSVYMMRVRNAGRIGIFGSSIEDQNRKVLISRPKVTPQWSNLPYMCETTQDINTALSSVYDHVRPGDVVKGYHTFAMLNQQHKWVGSLTHMRPGEGYMLLHQWKEGETDLIVSYQTLSQSHSILTTSNNAESEIPLLRSHNMPIVATCKIQLATCNLSPALGDRLQAYVGNELVGEAIADEDGRFMLMTSADEGTTMHFVYTPADPALGAEEGSFKSLPIVQYGAEKAALGTIEHPYEIVFDQTTEMATVYPSPFTDHLTFAVTCNSSSSPFKGDRGGLPLATCHLQLTTATGTLIWEHEAEITDGLWQYTLSHLDYLPAGVYIATIRLADRVTNVKLIKE